MGVVVYVRDAVDERPLLRISVTDLLTGEAVLTDEDGRAAFPERSYTSGLLRLALEGPGHAPRLFARVLPQGDGTRSRQDYPWVLTLELDPLDRLVSPAIGAAGASYSTTVPTGIVFDGEEYRQACSLDVPPEAWRGSYRLGFSPMSNGCFAQAGHDVPAPGMYPVAGFTFRFLDPDTKEPVAGEPMARPLAITLAPAYPKDFDACPAPVRTWRVDCDERAFTTAGVVSTELAPDGRVRVVVDEPGTYQVFAGEPLPDASPRSK